jgi:hypothetical protein
MIAAYLEGASAKQAAALLGYSNVTCLNILKRRDLIARSSGEARSVPRDHADAMIEAYLNGATSTKAASIFGYSNSTCINVLKQRSIMIRTRSEALRRNALDERYFDSIDTEDRAYWLGFLTADGCVRERGSVDINLQIGDSIHLQKFAESLHAEHSVGFREVVSSNGTVCPQATIRISSIKLVAALNCLGLWPNKTFNVRPCEQVSEPFLAAYWRGIFDGDGWIYFNDIAKKPRYCIGLCGNEAIVSGFAEFIGQFILSKAKVIPSGRIFKIAYEGRLLAGAVAKVLYSGATIYLDRKYALARQLCGDLPS